MRKIIILALMLLFCLSLPCLASPTEIITEGTYIASDNDSPAQGEEAALLKAKRSALEQAIAEIQPTLQLSDEQVKALPPDVMETIILEKTRNYNGKNMVFVVKIKSVIDPDRLTDNLKQGYKAEKPVMGIVTLVDLEPGAKFDAKTVKDQKYDFSQFTEAFHVADPFSQAIASKYTSRSFLTEKTEALTAFLQKEYTKTNRIDTAVLSAAAKQYKYDYLLVNLVKFSRIERITGTAFFTLEMKMYWQVDANTSIYLYDAQTDKLLLCESFNDKKESQYSAGSWFNSPAANAEEKALDAVVKDVSQSLIDKEIKKLPRLQ